MLRASFTLHSVNFALTPDFGLFKRKQECQSFVSTTTRFFATSLHLLVDIEVGQAVRAAHI